MRECSKPHALADGGPSKGILRAGVARRRPPPAHAAIACGKRVADTYRRLARHPAFAAGLSVLTAFLFGLAPALRASRADLNDALREGESRTSSAKGGRMRYLLVISEVALAMVLLVGSGLMINSLMRMLLPSPGFDPANLLTMAVNFPGTEGKYLEKIPGKDATKISPKVTAYHQQLIERVVGLPGVES